MDKKMIESLATVLHNARTQAKSIGQISKIHQHFNRPEAYQIQELQYKLRADHGERFAGWKMGLTSEAKRKQMNLDSPLYGFLTQSMQVPNGGEFSLKNAIHPKIEPEIAFLISKDLGPKTTKEDVLNACSGVAAAMEILDSRYDEFKYFSMEDVIADNSSSSHFVVGEWQRNVNDLDLIHLSMTMYLDDNVVQKGISKDISGDPTLSVVQLCQLLGERDQILKAGSIVLAGAATAAVELKLGQKFKLDVEGLANVSVSIGG